MGPEATNKFGQITGATINTLTQEHECTPGDANGGEWASDEAHDCYHMLADVDEFTILFDGPMECSYCDAEDCHYCDDTVLHVHDCVNEYACPARK